MGMIEISDQNFESEILKSEKLSLLDFGGEHCQPCKRLDPVLGELAGEYQDRIVIGHCDVAKGPQMAMRFGVMSIPTVVFFKNGQEVDRFIGLMDRDKIAKKIEGHLG